MYFNIYDSKYVKFAQCSPTYVTVPWSGLQDTIKGTCRYKYHFTYHEGLYLYLSYIGQKMDMPITIN